MVHLLLVSALREGSPNAKPMLRLEQCFMHPYIPEASLQYRSRRLGGATMVQAQL